MWVWGRQSPRVSHQLRDHGRPQGSQVLRGHAQQEHPEEQEDLSVQDGHLWQT